MKNTKREVINMMLADEVIASNEIYSEYLKHELELLDKKASNKKPTATQKANEGLKEIILNTLTSEGMTISELQALDATLGAENNQKISALTRLLKKEGKVKREMDGKKALFSLAD